MQQSNPGGVSGGQAGGRWFKDRGGWTMQGKWVADQTTRGLERGRWTAQGCVVEVAVLQPIG
jgi:hypothetical protein